MPFAIPLTAPPSLRPPAPPPLQGSQAPGVRRMSTSAAALPVPTAGSARTSLGPSTVNVSRVNGAQTLRESGAGAEVHSP